ncbi:hypothetical protein M0804_007416 [Polistes exclamans]|nr:hypothetical protein M0804_007416 [Polistes exclamans]
MGKNLRKINRCYCNCDWNPSCLLNLTSCFSEYSAFVSLPYFYKANATASNQVVGMRSSKENHSYQITFDLAAGIILKFSARLQINMSLPSLYGDVSLQNFSQIYFPILLYSMEFNAVNEMISALQDVHYNAHLYTTVNYVPCSMSIL